MKRLPIKLAKDVANTYKQDQVIVVAWDKTNNRTHVVTYGKTIEDCKQAAMGGNFIKIALGWPESKCNTIPARAVHNK